MQGRSSEISELQIGISDSDGHVSYGSPLLRPIAGSALPRNAWAILINQPAGVFQ